MPDIQSHCDAVKDNWATHLIGIVVAIVIAGFSFGALANLNAASDGTDKDAADEAHARGHQIITWLLVAAAIFAGWKVHKAASHGFDYMNYGVAAAAIAVTAIAWMARDAQSPTTLCAVSGGLATAAAVFGGAQLFMCKHSLGRKAIGIKGGAVSNLEIRQLAPTTEELVSSLTSM